MPKASTPITIADREAQDWFTAAEAPLPKISFEIVIMTPGRAAQILEGNVDNRRIRKGAVDNLAKAIKRDEWKLSHQAIAISEDGRLLDGQHRLLAIKQAGVPVPVTLATQADEQTFDVLDQGVKRTMQDIIGGNRQVLQVSSILSRMLYNENDNSMQRAEELHHLIGDLAERICEGATDVNRINIGAIRAGVVLRATLGNQGYIKGLWHGVVNQTTETLPPVGHAFLRKMNQTHRRHTGHSVESSNICIGWALADIDRREQTRFNVPPVAATLTEMRKVLHKYLAAGKAAGGVAPESVAREDELPLDQA